LASSTPACLTVSPNHVTPPKTPGKPQISSPPRFFFPPDFSLPEDDKRTGAVLDQPSDTSTCQQTPSSFGKTPRPRRHRTKFTPTQISVLESEFNKCSYISSERRKELSERLGIRELTIRVWFQNRRTLRKKMENNRPTHTTE
jgi:hypothetical protein